MNDVYSTSTILEAIADLNVEARKTALRGVANSSIFRAIGLAQALVMQEDSAAARQATLRQADSATARSNFDNSTAQRDAPVGLGGQLTREEQLAGLTDLYMECKQACEALAETPYDLPMKPEDAFDLMATPNTGRQEMEFAKIMSEVLEVSLDDALERVKAQKVENAEVMNARKTKILSLVEGSINEAGSEHSERMKLRYLGEQEATIATKVGQVLDRAITRTSEAALKYSSVNLMTIVSFLKDGKQVFDTHAKSIYQRHVGEPDF